MAFLEGKSPGEKKKIVAAAILGVISLAALFMAFGPRFGGSTTTATTKASPTPASKTSNQPPPAGANDRFRLPTADENALNIVVPVTYNPGSNGAPDPGRNIFAFYEPPEPTPFVPPPATPPPPMPTPTPPPPPPFTIARVTPSSVYAGSKGGFRMDVYGEGFVPGVRIYFNQTEMPTEFVNAQALATTIPENLVAQEGQRQIIIQTPDGRLYSHPFSMSVMPAPKPSGLQFIGMIGRQRYNNDTAYFMESGRSAPFGARLNDVIGGRFRLVAISAKEVTVQDTQLPFKHKIPMTTTPSVASGAPPSGGFIPYNPGGNTPAIQMPGGRTAPQPVQPRPESRRPANPPTSKDDVDDNDIP